MATVLTENCQKGDNLIFDQIINYAYQGITKDTYNVLRRMVDDGVLQIETLVEQAISKAGQLERESIEGRDFVDGSDAKKAITTECVEPSKNTYRRVAHISNIKGKQGILRIVVSETVNNKLHYFAIPKYAYEGLQSIRIYFNWDGTPKLGGKWFVYRCKSFEQMANIKDEDINQLMVDNNPMLRYIINTGTNLEG